jgi:hypothetical protein
VFTAALEYLRTWLGRDRSRSLEISWTDGGETKSVSIRGEAIDQSVLKTLADAAASRLGETPWESPPTERS